MVKFDAEVLRTIDRLVVEEALRRHLGVGARDFFPLRGVEMSEEAYDAAVAAARAELSHLA